MSVSAYALETRFVNSQSFYGGAHSVVTANVAKFSEADFLNENACQFIIIELLVSPFVTLSTRFMCSMAADQEHLIDNVCAHKHMSMNVRACVLT